MLLLQKGKQENIFVSFNYPKIILVIKIIKRLWSIFEEITKNPFNIITTSLLFKVFFILKYIKIIYFLLFKIYF